MKINDTEIMRTIFNGERSAGLDTFMKKHKGSLQLIDSRMIQKMIRKRPADGHKGTFGHGLIIAGSAGKYGAAILASGGALRTGCGLLTSMVPDEAVIPLLVHLPEAMTISARDDLSADSLNRFSAIGFGPGAGTDEKSEQLLYRLLKEYKGYLVIDADGLNILANRKDWLPLLNSNMVLTPHPIEFDRLTTSHAQVLDRLATQIAFAKEYNVNILIKGAHTSIVTGKGIFFNTTGNDGMATAGSGDVLTGIITSLCAQGYKPGTAIIAGVYLHGYAGDIAAKDHSRHSLLATDIINGIEKFFMKFEK